MKDQNTVKWSLPDGIRRQDLDLNADAFIVSVASGGTSVSIGGEVSYGLDPLLLVYKSESAV